MTRRLPLFPTVILKTILIETFQGRRRCRGCSWRWGRGSSSWGGGEQTDTALFFFLHIVVHKSVSQPPTYISLCFHGCFWILFFFVPKTWWMRSLILVFPIWLSVPSPLLSILKPVSWSSFCIFSERGDSSTLSDSQIGDKNLNVNF